MAANCFCQYKISRQLTIHPYAMNYENCMQSVAEKRWVLNRTNKLAQTEYKRLKYL